VNHKRVWRLYREAKLSVRKRRRPRRLQFERQPLASSQELNDVWSADFVMDALASGRGIKCLTVVDDFSRECVQIAVDHGMGGDYVARLLGRAALLRGYPKAIRTDQGPEFTSRAFMAWATARGVKHLINDAGCPTQNAYIESFNGKFRDECLDEQWFQSLWQARQEIARWRRDYKQGARRRLQGFVHAAVEFDFVVERAENVGDGALFGERKFWQLYVANFF